LEGDAANVEIMVTNISNKNAFNPFIYIRLCKDCKYAAEPEGFSYVPGAQSTERERHYDRLMGLARLPRISLSVVPPPNVESFPIGFFYGCDNCGPIDGDKPQLLTVKIQKPANQETRTQPQTPPSPKNPEKQDVGLKFVMPEDTAFEIVNLSGQVVRDSK
jgi:hypothetical protein